MKRNFTTFSFMRIPKLEFPGFINSIVVITDKYDPVALYINTMYAKLKEKQPLLGNLEIVYKKEPETAVLIALRNKRENLLRAVLDQTRALSKAGVASQTEPLKLVLPFVEKYFNNIIANNTKTRSERINQMFTKLDADDQLQDALTVVGLIVFLNELRPLQHSLEQTQNLRRTVKSARPRMKTKEVKAEITLALLNYLKSIELAIIEHPTVDYTALVNEINELLISYKAALKARATRNKNAAGDAKPKSSEAA